MTTTHTSVWQATVKLRRTLDKCFAKQGCNSLICEPRTPPLVNTIVVNLINAHATHVPLVIHFFVPLMIQCLPSGVLIARVRIPETSLPENASVTARHKIFFPESASGMTLALRAGEPKWTIGGRPMSVPLSRPAREAWSVNRNLGLLSSGRRTITITTLSVPGQFLVHNQLLRGSEEARNKVGRKYIMETIEFFG